MTEQEIVSVLKGNRTKGVAFGFMPREVQQYITFNFKNLLFLNGENQWVKTLEKQRCWNNMIFALPEDFELKERPQSGWAEFEIKKNGRFTAFDVDDNDHQIRFSFGWHQWSEFLECSYEHDLGYTAFGGWQFESNGYWLTEPHVIGKEGLLTTLTDYNEDCRPAIPIKIRFWRENK